VAGAKQTFRLKFQLENILVPFMRIYWQKFVDQSPDLVVPHGGAPRGAAPSPAGILLAVVVVSILCCCCCLFVCLVLCLFVVVVCCCCLLLQMTCL
jgi:hypothetical protein